MEDPSLLEETSVPLEPTEANRGVPLRLGYVSCVHHGLLCSWRDYVFLFICFGHDFIPANRLQEPSLVLLGLVKPLLLVQVNSTE